MLSFNQGRLVNLYNWAHRLPPPSDSPSWKKWLFNRRIINAYSLPSEKMEVFPVLSIKTLERQEHGVQVSFGFSTNPNDDKVRIAQLMKFELDYYPHCCAMYSFQGFSYLDIVGFNDRLVEEVLMRTLGALGDTGPWSNRRLHVMMVESSSADDNRDPLVIYKDTNPVNSIKYNTYYKLFHKHAQVQTVVGNNANTGNKIHMMDVVFPAKSFDNFK